MKSDVAISVKELGWSAIKLTQSKYRGAIQVYKGKYGENVPIFFYLDECFIIEDEDGLFTKDDLRDFFMKGTIDLEATGCIRGLSLVSYVEETRTGNLKVVHNTDLLKRFDLDKADIKSDIQNRLYTVYKLGEMIDAQVKVG